MANLVISGITSCQSRGVEALVRSILERLPASARVTVLTQTPDYDSKLLAGPGARYVHDPFVHSRSLREPEIPGQAADDVLANCDVLIGTGGDLYTPDYNVCGAYLRAIDAATARGVPVAMIGQSMGPFAAGAQRDELTRSVNNIALLTVREPTSLHYLVHELKVAPQQVRLSADPAFLLSAASSARADEILASIGIASSTPFAVVAPSAGISTFGNVEQRRHTTALTRLVDRLGHERQIVLVPHAHDVRPFNDDRILARDIAASTTAPQVSVLDGNLTAPDYKAVVARAEIVLAERLHVAIGALSSTTPVALIGHSHKFDGVLSYTYAGAAPAGMYWHVRDFVADEAASDAVVRLSNDRQQLADLRGALSDRRPEMSQLAQNDLDSIVALASA